MICLYSKDSKIIRLKNNVKFEHSVYYWLSFSFFKLLLSNNIIPPFYGLERIEQCLIFPPERNNQSDYILWF